ncbi:MAG: BTAD domain-containing putative transcriptional regulator [Aeromicrobium sp.]
MPHVRLHLLGGFELTIDGQQAAALQPGSQRLLAFVALTLRGVERDFAAQQLWPDSTEERARANLRSSLWRLRRLPVSLVETTPTRLRLADSVWVDIRDGIGELTEADGWEGPVALDSLFVDLLPDWYDEWLTIEREKLRQVILRALEDRARLALARGDPGEAIQVGLTAMAIDPLRETTCRLLMEVHLSEGNEYDAQRALDDYRRRLACDPRVSVSAETEELLHRNRGPAMPETAVAHRIGG